MCVLRLATPSEMPANSEPHETSFNSHLTHNSLSSFFPFLVRFLGKEKMNFVLIISSRGDEENSKHKLLSARAGEIIQGMSMNNSQTFLAFECVMHARTFSTNLNYFFFIALPFFTVVNSFSFR
jgi:hypothetical protein